MFIGIRRWVETGVGATGVTTDCMRRIAWETTMSEVREAIASATRIVVKVGSPSLTSEVGGVDEERLSAMRRMSRLVEEPRWFSSAAEQSRRISHSAGSAPADLATQQASAASGNAAGALHALLRRAWLNGGSGVADVEDVTRRNHHRNAQRTLFRLLELGVIPVVNENDTVATDEIA